MKSSFSLLKVSICPVATKYSHRKSDDLPRPRSPSIRKCCGLPCLVCSRDWSKLLNSSRRPQKRPGPAILSGRNGLNLFGIGAPTPERYGEKPELRPKGRQATQHAPGVTSWHSVVSFLQPFFVKSLRLARHLSPHHVFPFLVRNHLEALERPEPRLKPDPSCRRVQQRKRAIRTLPGSSQLVAEMESSECVSLIRSPYKRNTLTAPSTPSSGLLDAVGREQPRVSLGRVSS